MPASCAPVDQYLSLEALKAALRLTGEGVDDALRLAIAAASRRIDRHCDDQFWRTAPATVRSFVADDPRRLWVGSFADADTVVVALDCDDDGVFETVLDVGEWRPAPTEPPPGEPYREIQLVGSRCFPGTLPYGYPLPSYGYPPFGYGNWGWPYGGSPRARVRVSARWGWPAVPPQVTQACQILAIDYFKSKDMTNGAAGITGISTGAFGGQRGVLVTEAALNPLAAALLSGLGELVVA